MKYMKIKKIEILFGLFLLICFGCGGLDEIIDLGGGYYYYGEGGSSNYIFKEHEKESGFEYSIDRRVIEANVSNFEFNNEDILVFQEPDYQTAINHIVFEKMGPFFSEEERVCFEKKADSIFRQSSYWKKIFKNKKNYYIINKKLDKVYGPLIKTRYLQLKDSLGVSKGLVLK